MVYCTVVPSAAVAKARNEALPGSDLAGIRAAQDPVPDATGTDAHVVPSS